MRTQNTNAKNVQTNNVAAQQLLAAPVAAQQVAPTQAVAVEQPVALVTPVVTAGQQVTVPQPSSLRAARIARVQVALHARYRAAKLDKHNNANTHAKQQAYMLAVQQLAASMGVPVPNTLSVRNIATPQQHAPSNVQGACATVRAFVHANPTLTRKQVQQHFSGTINPATVSTQYQLAKQGKA